MLISNSTVVFLSVESYTSCWGFLCNIQLPVILTISMRKFLSYTDAKFVIENIGKSFRGYRKGFL